MMPENSNKNENAIILSDKEGDVKPVQAPAPSTPTPPPHHELPSFTGFGAGRPSGSTSSRRF